MPRDSSLLEADAWFSRHGCRDVYNSDKRDYIFFSADFSEMFLTNMDQKKGGGGGAHTVLGCPHPLKPLASKTHHSTSDDSVI